MYFLESLSYLAVTATLREILALLMKSLRTRELHVGEGVECSHHVQMHSVGSDC